MPTAGQGTRGHHAFMRADGSTSLTFNYDQVVDVPRNKSTRALERLSPTMHPTGTGIFPSPYKYPCNMRLRGPLRGHRPIQALVPLGSDHFEHTVAGHEETACGEQIQHFKAKNYASSHGKRCHRQLDSVDTIPSRDTLRKQHLFDYSSAIQVPAQDASTTKPKNMKHPGLVLPPALTTTQCLFTFNPQKTGTPMRLKSVAGRVSPEVPRYVTHDFTSMSPAVQANYRQTKTNLFPRSESSASDYTTEYRRRYVSSREPPRTAGAPVLRRSMDPTLQPSSSIHVAQPLLLLPNGSTVPPTKGHALRM